MGLCIRYEDCPQGAGAIRAYEGRIEPVAGMVYVYATIRMGPANPVDYAGNLPCWNPRAGAETVGADEHGGEAAGELAAALGGFVPGQQWDALPEDLPTEWE